MPTSRKINESKLSVRILQERSNQTIFKTRTNERASAVGSFKYIGYRYVYHEENSQPFKKKWKNLDGTPLSLHIKMYFYVYGAKHKGKKRQRYLICAQFPFKKGFETLETLYDTPVKLFSSDPSFKYFFSYALNKENALIVDEYVILKHLGNSIKNAPKKRNPNLHTELTKHFFKFFEFVRFKRPQTFLQRRYFLKKQFKMPIINTNAS